MTSTFTDDIYLTNSIIGFLYAGYQGAFAALNLLTQLGYQHFNPDEMSDVERSLNDVDKWRGDLLKGLPCFSVTWKSPQTVTSKKAFESLLNLRTNITHTVGQIRKCLIVQDLASNPEETKYLIAAFARQAYSRDNYVRGFIELGQSFKHQDMVNQYSTFLDEAGRGLQVAHMFFNLFMSEEDLQPIFFRGLREECVFLPGIFQSQIHEINLLLNAYNGPITYDKLGIIPQHMNAWGGLNMPPAAAGYWQAWEFSPQEAASWIELGLNDPRTAWFWELLGFPPSEAFEWAKNGFTPPAARSWCDNGDTPETALKKIEDQAVREQMREREDREALQEKPVGPEPDKNSGEG